MISDLIDFLSNRGANKEYLEKLSSSLCRHDLHGVVFGDIFLEDRPQSRERSLASLMLRSSFRIWKADLRELIREFLVEGFEAVVCCVDDRWLDDSPVGWTLDELFVRSSPPQSDAWGENEKQHSFVFAGPIFTHAVKYSLGRKYSRTRGAMHPGSHQSLLAGNQRWGFWFCELSPQ